MSHGTIVDCEELISAGSIWLCFYECWLEKSDLLIVFGVDTAFSTFVVPEGNILDGGSYTGDTAFFLEVLLNLHESEARCEYDKAAEQDKWDFHGRFN